MSKRSLITLVVVLAVVVPLALGGLAVVLGGGDDRSIGAISSIRVDEYERAYGTDLYVGTSGGVYNLGPPRSATGCGSAAGVTTSPGPNGAMVKEPTAPTPQPCVLVLTAGRLPAAFFDLVDDMLDGQAGRTDFWLVNRKRDGTAGNGLHIDDALMEVTFGKLDGDALDELHSIVLSLRPEAVVELATCCNTFSPTLSAASSHQQVFANRFTATLSGITGGQDIIEITEWTIKQVASGTDISTELGDLSFRAIRHPTNGFRQWLTTFGQSPADEKTMTIDFKRGISTNIAYTLSLTGVGIRGHERLGWGSQGNAGQVLSDRFTLYVQGGSATGGVASSPQPGSAPAPPPSPPPATPPPASPPPASPPPASPPPPPDPRASPPPPPVETTEEGLAAPTRVTAKLISRSDAELAWAPVEGAEGYVVLMTLEPEGKYVEVARSEKPSATVSKLEGGPPYYFVVRALRGEQQSKDSAVAEALG